MTPEFTLEPAVIADLPVILPLVEDLHNGEQIEMPGEARLSALHMIIEKPEIGGLWVMRAGGAVIGYVAIAYGFSIVFGGRDAFLDEICIAPEWRGQGIGAAAIEQLKSKLIGHDIKALHLEVNKDNHRAQRLYGSLGFEMRAQYHLMTVEF